MFKKYCIKEYTYEVNGRKEVKAIRKDDSLNDCDPEAIAYYDDLESARNALQEKQSSYSFFTYGKIPFIHLIEYWLCELDEKSSDLENEELVYYEIENSNFQEEQEKILEENNGSIWKLKIYEDEQRYCLDEE